MRRLASATAALATAVLVGSAVPAFGFEVPPNPIPFPNEFAPREKNPTCEQIGELIGIELTTAYRVDPPEDVDDDYITAVLSEDGTELTVSAYADNVFGITVKGGPGAYFYWDGNFEGMTAPETGGGQVPKISHYDVCLFEDTPTSPPTTPPTTPTETPTETPSKTPTTSPTSTPSGTVSPAVSPKPVPTAVPAGTDGGGAGMAPIVAFLLVGGAAAGAAAVGRRYFVHDA